MLRNFFKSPYLIFHVIAFLQWLLVLPDATAQAPAYSKTITDTSGLIAPGDSLRLLSKQFAFTEGPAVDKAGNIYFTDQPADNIWKWSIDGSLSLFLHGSGRANGLFIDSAGNIIACADEKNELRKISPDKRISVLYKAPKHRRLNGPNDLWIDARGGIYITDPYYQRPYWKRNKPALQGQYVYYLPARKRKLITVDTTLAQPNGIVGSPDGRHLYVADIGGGKTFRFDVSGDGTLTNRTLFAAQGADGITLDERGNLYLAGNGVAVYNSQGKKIAHIDIPAKWTSNVCFGGQQKSLLFITASEGVYLLQMQVRGVE